MSGTANGYHALLARQLKRYPDLAQVAEDHPDWLKAIDAVYRESDEDRKLLERSLELTSDELMARNQQLQADISRREQAERQLAYSLSLLNATLNATADGILVTDLNRRIIKTNDRFIEMWGVPLELTQDCSADWLVEFLKNKVRDPHHFRSRIEAIYADPLSTSTDLLRLTDGRIFKRICQPQQMAGKVVGRVACFQDVTEELRGQEELRRLAFHDDLTGLPNRTLFTSRLESVLKADPPGQIIAVLFMDVDRFKVINDGLGHDVGDRLLIAVAERLREAVPEGGLVARFGGDEFVAFVPVKTSDDATVIALHILTSIRQSIRISKHESYNTVSIGVAVGQSGEMRAEELLRNADTAMYHAKRNGRARHEVFTTSMYEQAVSLMHREADLRKACLTMDQFELLYQPIVNPQRALVGMEALIRWRFDGQLLTPDKFLEVAEETGLMGAIGGWVIKEACRTLAMVRKDYPDLFVAVNLSVSQLEAEGLTELVMSTLRQHGLPPEALHLELTETELMEHAGTSSETLTELRAIGIPISMDDFGTGYSSLSYLSRLSLDTLKVDRSFVRGLPHSKESVAITLAVLALARSLGLSVVAEGVETEEQAAFLTEQGCPFLQGYLYGRPMPVKEIRSLHQIARAG